MTTTTIETSINRKIIVNTFGKTGSVDLDVNDTSKFPDDGKRVYSLLRHEEAAQIGLALLGENATVVTDLPEVKVSLLPFDAREVVRAGDTSYYIDRDPELILRDAKEVLAIHAFLVKRNEEQEAAKKAEAEAVKAKEATRDKRREELRREFGAAAFYTLPAVARAAIDRIVDLEEAAKVS